MINSHIQMPKLLLKNFQNESNLFYYYDVKKGVIGNKGSAKTINTSLGYYSSITENYLNNEIETPFSNILKYLHEVGLGNESTISLKINIRETVLNFMYALITRAPSFHKMMDNDEDEELSNLSTDEKRDYIIKNGIRIAKENYIFDDYIVTFMINNTDVPFVLSMNGIYNYTFNGYQAINLPISPRTTISLMHPNLNYRLFHDDGAISMFNIDRSEDIMLMNKQAFLFQLKHNWGYVICSQKEELQRLSDEIK